MRLAAKGQQRRTKARALGREGLALCWSFIGPSETVELNARGRLDATSCRYRGIYERLFTSMQRRVDWAGSVFGTVERQRPA